MYQVDSDRLTREKIGDWRPSSDGCYLRAGSLTIARLPGTQVDFLKSALKRVKSEKFKGAMIIAVHHPPYVANRDT
jgi:hypothetical protein